MKKFLIIIFLGLISIGCKTKNIKETTNQNPVDSNISTISNTKFLEKILVKSSFNQLKINSKIDVQTDNFIPTLDAVIYIENGQKIWMNLSALFLNVARGIATNQGIKAYEKYNKTYIDSNFGYLNNLLNVNFIDYQSFQNLLLGKTFIPINAEDFELNQNMEGYVLKSRGNQKIMVNGKQNEYTITLQYSSDFLLNRALLENVQTQDNLVAEYSNWITFNGESVPQNVKIIIKGQKTSQILIENTKFDDSKIETPYSVPANYTKKEIR